jgi:hypothetical protein
MNKWNSYFSGGDCAIPYMNGIVRYQNLLAPSIKLGSKTNIAHKHKLNKYNLAIIIISQPHSSPCWT